MEFPIDFLADDNIKPKWNTQEGLFRSNLLSLDVFYFLHRHCTNVLMDMNTRADLALLFENTRRTCDMRN